MGIVGGSRHYTAPGLGAVTSWNCPACGESNVGPLDAGCVHCGSGSQAAHRAAATPPPPPLLEQRAAVPDALAAIGARWAQANSHATLADAYLAGYMEGIRAARRVPPPRPVTEAFPPEGKVNRTIVAALELFRDQVLAGASEAIASGEWLTVDEVNQLIANLAEPAHA